MRGEASMRPGQTAPECAEAVSYALAGLLASMRPGQTAPECSFVAKKPEPRKPGFNEAGADCPGMPPRDWRMHYPITRFNEAGADCPGMRGVKHISANGFRIASMRPGQTAPECDPRFGSARGTRACFNEAGADCPGMP